MRNFGFIAPEIKPEDFWLGSKKLGSQEINPSGDWKFYVPIFEPQSKTIDTNSCVTFAMTSALEMISKLQYEFEPNFSDRFTAKMSGTNPATGGNTPPKVIDTIRHKGAIPEEKYPFVDNLAEYFQEVPQNLVDLGVNWLKLWDVGYEWATTSTLRNALKRSPVCVAVSAWQQNSDGEYIRFGQSNHYVVLIGYDNKDRPIIWDSYAENIKTLTKDFVLEFPMMFVLKKKPEPMITEYYQTGFFGKIWLMIKKFLWL